MHRPGLTRAVRLTSCPCDRGFRPARACRGRRGRRRNRPHRSFVDPGDFRLARELLVAEHHEHLAGRRAGLGHRLGNVLGALAGAADEDSRRVGFDRPQFGVRFGKEAEVVVAHVELLGQFLDAVGRPHGRGQHHQVGFDRKAARRPGYQRRGPSACRSPRRFSTRGRDGNGRRPARWPGGRTRRSSCRRSGCPYRTRGPGRHAPCACRAWCAWR